MLDGSVEGQGTVKADSRRIEMRILVVSDSHGRNDYVVQAVEQAERTGYIDVLIHLGDVEDDVEELESLIDGDTYIVAGNNDGGLALPDHMTIELCGKRIFLTHGHRYMVNYDLNRLGMFGTMNRMDIVMFGHTHYPYLDRGEDIMLLNPGSLAYPRQEGRARTFMLMEMDEQGNVEYHWQELEEEDKKASQKGWLGRLFGD